MLTDSKRINEALQEAKGKMKEYRLSLGSEINQMWLEEFPEGIYYAKYGSTAASAVGLMSLRWETRPLLPIMPSTRVVPVKHRDVYVYTKPLLIVLGISVYNSLGELIDWVRAHYPDSPLLKPYVDALNYMKGHPKERSIWKEIGNADKG